MTRMDAAIHQDPIFLCSDAAASIRVISVIRVLIRFL